uniref:Uncharacterized protein n=1 Tax=viral metagenome TaxID=1070528 RepID=A0A6M3LNY7_9ZZZZ
MKTTQKQFELFKSECQKWIDRFEISHWDIVYEHKAEKGNYANTLRNIESLNAVIGLGEELDIDGLDLGISIDDYIKVLAKHEVLHILCGKVSEYGTSREFTFTDIRRAEEELVRKLEKIIN